MVGHTLPRFDAEGNPVEFQPELVLEMVHAKDGTTLSSNGFSLLKDEQEVYAEGFIPLSFFTRRQGYWQRLVSAFSRVCGCYLTIPRMNSKLEICVTDQRLLMWEAGRQVLPGTNSLWYHLCCCWMCPKETDSFYDNQIVHLLSDVKAVKLEAVKKTGRLGLVCCPMEVEYQQFELLLLLIKPVGVFHRGENWEFCGENKVSFKFLEVKGYGDMEKSQELRRVLESVANHNLEKDAEVAAISQRLMVNAGGKTGGKAGVKLGGQSRGPSGEQLTAYAASKTTLISLRVSQLILSLISFAIMANVVQDVDADLTRDVWDFTLAVGVLTFLGSIVWLSAIMTMSTTTVTSPPFLYFFFLYDLVFIALAFSSASTTVPKLTDRNLRSLFPEEYDKVSAASAFMYLTGFSLALGAACFKLSRVLGKKFLLAASSIGALLALRVVQLVLAVVSMAIMADVYANPDQDDSVFSETLGGRLSVETNADTEETWAFVLAVGAILTFGSLIWMIVIASSGKMLTSQSSTMQAYHMYDIIFIILVFSSASAAVIQDEVSEDLDYEFPTVYAKVQASSGIMYLAGIALLCSAALV